MTNDLINEIILDALCSDEPFVAAVPVVRGERIENKGRPKYSSCGLFCNGIDNPLDPFIFCPNYGATMDGERKEDKQ